MSDMLVPYRCLQLEERLWRVFVISQVRPAVLHPIVYIMTLPLTVAKVATVTQDRQERIVRQVAVAERLGFQDLAVMVEMPMAAMLLLLMKVLQVWLAQAIRCLEMVVRVLPLEL